MVAGGDIDDGLVGVLFPEISKEAYCGEGYERSREKILMSMRALLWMAADEYEKFVEGQEEERKLSRQRWEEVRSIMTWAGLEKIELHACLVLLAVRGLGDR